MAPVVPREATASARHRRSHMHVAFVCSDVSSNALGRVHVLAQACRPFADVSVWGSSTTGEVWGPLASSALRIEIYPLRDWPGYRSDARRFSDAMARQADVLYPVKPLRASYGVARLARRRHGTPLVLDIDDWELGFLLSGGVRWKILADGLRRWRQNPSYFPTRRLEGLARGEPFKTVSNTFLQRRFGGVPVPSGRDPDVQDPARYDSAEIKRTRGLEGRRVVLFFGTPRAHKGLADLVHAVAAIPDPDVVCVVAGVRADDAAARALAARAPGRVQILGEHPFERLAEIVALADVYVVPQRGGVATLGQMPAKVYDAMAMAKPIVATAVGDLPATLSDGCGLLVPAGSVSALSQAIGQLLADPGAAAAMGRRARERLCREYSVRAMTGRLQPMLEAAMAAGAGRRG